MPYGQVKKDFHEYHLLYDLKKFVNKAAKSAGKVDFLAVRWYDDEYRTALFIEERVSA